MTLLFLLLAYLSCYLLGHAKGEIHEREREERAAKRAEEKIVHLKDYR